MAIKSYTVSEIFTHVRTRVSDQAQAFTGDTLLQQLIEEAQNEIVDEIGGIKATTALSSVADQAAYTLPVDFMKVRVVQWVGTDQNIKLKYITPEEYRRYNFITTTNQPEKFTIIANTLYIYRTPDSAGSSNITVDYIAYPTALSDSDSVPLNDIDRYYPLHQAIIYYCLAEVHAMKRNNIEAALFRSRYKEKVANFIRNHGSSVEGFGASMSMDAGDEDIPRMPYIPTRV